MRGGGVPLKKFIVLIICLFSPSAFADWNLTFQDEFNGSSLNTSNWMTTFPDGTRANDNAEQEYYVDNAFTFPNPGVNGYVQINTTKTTTPYSVCYNGTCLYTSGMLSSYSHFSQAYGYYECRAQIAAGQGLWPAFWMIPNNLQWPPEIDILEILGQTPNDIYTTYHDANNDIYQTYTIVSGLTTAFHLYAVDWEPGSIKWYVDGNQVYTTSSNVTSLPFYIIFNYAIGGNWGGYPDSTTITALQNNTVPVKVDYIRAYMKVPNGTGDYSSIPGPTPIPTLHGTVTSVSSWTAGVSCSGCTIR